MAYAIMIVVLPSETASSDFCMPASVWESRAAVASSSIRILGDLKNALAIDIWENK
jgi:hypothetical protein